ncbi:tRNA 2-selenouridine(34) synthase MnmH [Crenobacter intestini]|uniref:tRNA 2-selenouridine(34) synthase MnmH n=1 Tax=Crenobacter intestini TaxID=2563443 RepID=A0A4T0UT94_9NEIS|nr:tRNA 2-selenouridine(34) synthase MnmH [Crenobacter intestini]TIC82152.1 tRNA 2-selenouridine(34) synthase MnmH [Crenobacter intestini]
MLYKQANVAQLVEFDEVIDVRSPSEFAEDHIPGAINCPVLDDDERRLVGTLYKQDSPFAARRVGAALVARNIARHIEEKFADRPKRWKPLIYCWRGGQRSGSMALIFSQVGWYAHQLDGGYKAYRRDLLERFDTLPATLDLRVVCGPTGSGKSRLLGALERAGRQVLDLEGLARHRGSVLGKLPDAPQPSQKHFDSLLMQAMLSLDPARPVYIESESKKIGTVALPQALFDRMHESRCVLVEAPLAERVRFLLEDYDFYVAEPARLIEQLNCLKALYPKETLAAWRTLIEGGDFDTLVSLLLTEHYDPLYRRSMGKHYAHLAQATPLALATLDDAALDTAARLLDA